MADFSFDPVTGWNDTDIFPDYPARDQVRPLLQRLFDQIKTAFNSHKNGNSHVGDIGFVSGVTSGPFTTSASYVDLANMSATITTNGGDVLVWFHGSFYNDVLGASNTIALTIDGATEVGIANFAQAVATYNTSMGTFWRFSGVSAGSHTIKVRFKTSTGTLASVAVIRQLLAIEVKAVV